MSEAQTFAASMHSSMMRWASLRSTFSMRARRPSPSKTNWVSIVSKSIAPRSSRALSSALKRVFNNCKRGSHRGIGEPRARAHDRRIEAIPADLTLRADRDVAGHAEAIDFRVERAQAVGELLRQHRDDPAGKVNRIAALARIQVERVAVAHVVADVRDRDDEPEP